MLPRVREHRSFVGDWDTPTTRAANNAPGGSWADTYAALSGALAGPESVEHAQL